MREGFNFSLALLLTGQMACGPENLTSQTDLPKPNNPPQLSSCSVEIQDFVTAASPHDVVCSWAPWDKPLESVNCTSLNTAALSDGLCVVDCNANHTIGIKKDSGILHVFDPDVDSSGGIQGKEHASSEGRYYPAAYCQTTPSALTKEAKGK